MPEFHPAPENLGFSANSALSVCDHSASSFTVSVSDDAFDVVGDYFASAAQDPRKDCWLRKPSGSSLQLYLNGGSPSTAALKWISVWGEKLSPFAGLVMPTLGPFTGGPISTLIGALALR